MTFYPERAESVWPEIALCLALDLRTGRCGQPIDHVFTVVCLVSWPLNESEAGGDLALIQTSLLFLF